MNVSASSPDRYALIGHPVNHSWSPFIHGMFARATLQHMQYRLIDADAERFRSAALEFLVQGGRGLNVTIPHKQAAAELVNEMTPRALVAGAVNTITVKADGELKGDNTDGIGLVIDLTENLKLGLAGKRILVLGAGGATRGVLGPLLAQKPELLAIANRTVERAAQLAASFTGRGTILVSGFDTIEPAPFDLVINATSASLQGRMPAIPDAVIGPASICYDMAYAPGDTPFTHWAAEHGASASYKGWGMLVEQAAEAFLVWRGVRPQTRHVLELLTAKGRELPRVTAPPGTSP